LTAYLQKEFEEFQSENRMRLEVNNKAEPWLGDPDNYIFRTLEEAIMKVWSPLFTTPGTLRKPLYIREGGSIPAIRFLEKEFNAPAAHLPCGQASDSAHLDNERLRVMNLLKSREIFAWVFGKL
jgi:di- and tripeptidase